MAKQARPWRSVSAARKDNVVFAALMLAPHGRTAKDLGARLFEKHAWATHSNTYIALMRLLGRGLVVRQNTPEGYLYRAVAPDPDDPLEQAFAEGTAPESDVPDAFASDRVNKNRRDIYTHDEIIAAVLRWYDKFGTVPRKSDWSPAKARLSARHHARKAVFHLQRIAVYDSGDWPSDATVVKYFGSWNAALAAAGFSDSLRSEGNQPREYDLKMVPGTGAAHELERMMDIIVQSHLDSNSDQLRAALLDLSLSARDWAMAIRKVDE